MIVNIQLENNGKLYKFQSEENMSLKNEQIIDLTRNKTQKSNIMINEELWELFKEACTRNNTTPTSKIEKWMINFVDENGLI